MKKTARSGSVNHAEQIRQQCDNRAKLWREHLASYQKVLNESPETFSEFSAEFQKRFLNAIHSKEKRKNSKLRHSD